MAISLFHRQQRAGLLCAHCLRNLAFYCAWFDLGRPHSDKNFWVNANGNFIEIAVLEWCKLFGDETKDAKRQGSYFYGKVVADSAAFRVALLNDLGIAKVDWETYRDSMKTYRDKYIAHWDEDLRGVLRPVMNVAKDSAIYLMDFLTAYGEDGFWQVPTDGAAFYEQCRQRGLAACGATYP